MKVWKKQKGLLVRTMICAVSLAAACFYGNSLPAQVCARRGLRHGGQRHHRQAL